MKKRERGSWTWRGGEGGGERGGERERERGGEGEKGSESGRGR
jgi:hypothetical protein